MIIKRGNDTMVLTFHRNDIVRIKPLARLKESLHNQSGYIVNVHLVSGVYTVNVNGTEYVFSESELARVIDIE